MEDNMDISSPNGNSTLTRENAHSPQDNQDASFNLLEVEEECFGEQEEGGDIIPFHFDQASMRSALVDMIIMDEYSLSRESLASLRNFTFTLQPLFMFPSLNEVKKDILQRYQEEKLTLMMSNDRNRSRVAITTEFWSSDEENEYMAVTAHYIDSSWNLQSRLLRCVYVMKSYVWSSTYVSTLHTNEVLTDSDMSEMLIDDDISEELIDTLMNILLDWNIDRKLSAITWDNCPINDTGKHGLLGRFDGSNLLLRGKLLHMRCCVHMLNLFVRYCLDIIKEGVEKIRNIVFCWSGLAKRRQTFVTYCRKSGVPFLKKPVVDRPREWNSTYVMLETACLYKDVFPCLGQKENQDPSVLSNEEWESNSQYTRENMLSNEEWELVKDICGILKLFYDVTQLFSRTKHPNADLYFTETCKLNLALDEWITSPNPLISRIACKMKRKFVKYWDDNLDIMSIAVILDPRYKMCLIEYYFSKLYPTDYPKQVERIKQVCYDLVNEYQLNNSSFSSSVFELSVEEADSGDYMSDFDLYVREKKAKVSSMSAEFNELDCYLAEDALPSCHGFDLLVWWKTTGAKYPTLQQIARDLLAIPMSIISSKSCFFESGRMISPRRSKMDDSEIEALMCLKNWMWASKNEDGTGYDCKDYSSDEEEW